MGMATVGAALLALAAAQAHGAEPIMQVWSGKGEVTHGGKTFTRLDHLLLMRLQNNRLTISTMFSDEVFVFSGPQPADRSTHEIEYSADRVQFADDGVPGATELAASGRCRIVYTPGHVLLSASCEANTREGAYDLRFTSDRRPARPLGPPERIPTPAASHTSG